MTTQFKLALGAMLLAGAVIGGCASNSTASSPPTSAPGANSYQQIEMFSRPAGKEAFELFEDHNKTNRSEPYADPVIQSQIKSFSLMFRSKQTAEALQSVLYPNVM